MLVQLKNKIDIIVICLIVFLLNVSLIFREQTLTVTIIAVVASVVVLAALLLYKELLLYALCFLVPFSISVPIGDSATINLPSEGLCVVLAVYFCIRIIMNHRFKKEFLYHPISILILADLTWMLITSCTSAKPEVSLKRFVVRVIYVLVYYVLFFELFKLNKRNILKAYLLICLGMIFPILYTLVKHSSTAFSSLGSTKACEPFYNDHTIYGAALVFFIPFLFYNSVVARQKLVTRALLLTIFLLFCLAAFLSYSRAAWLGLGISTMVYFLIVVKPKKIYLIGMALIISVTALVLKNDITNAFTNTKEVSHKADVATHLRSMANVKTDVSNTERLNRWKCAWRMFLDKPWLGFGPGTYQFFYGSYQLSNDITVISTYTGNKGHAHSEYLNYLCEEGIIGFLIFFSLVIVIFVRGIKVIYHTDDKAIKNTCFVVLLGLVTFFIHSFFNGFIETDKMAMPVFVSIAAIVSLDLAANSQKSHE